IGLTGAGKSTFICHCTQEATAQVGHGLHSCTSRVTFHTIGLRGGRKIHLVDTPGFDDNGRTDFETLQEIAYWLSLAYKHRLCIGGLIYLHRITDVRLQGAALRCLTVFKRMCGVENFYGLILATTRWDDLSTASSKEQELAKERHRELCSTDEFWGDMVKRKALVVQLDAGTTEPMRIVQHILNKERRMVLAIQSQLAVEGRSLHETDAGRFVYKSAESYRNNLQEKIEQVRNEIYEIISSSAAGDYSALSDLAAQVSTDLASLNSDMASLRVTSSELQDRWNARIEDDFESLQNKFATMITASQDEEDHVLLASEEEVVEAKRTKIVKKRGKSTLTAFTVISTGLAAGQLLAAAVACTVM
ncbi:hypothetical protein BDV96DRAFT_487804, partial [Lophiotrema nucula]